MNATDADRLDQILSSDDGIVPSSGFAEGVMEAVRGAAVEPAALPFPWRRFVAGLLGCSIGSALVTALADRFDWSVLNDVGAQLGAVAPELAFAAAVVTVSLAFVRVQRMLWN